MGDAGVEVLFPGGDRLLLGPVFDRFVEQTPVGVGVRAVLEAAPNADALDTLFGASADRPYEQDLLFSTCVDLMTGVVCRTHRSGTAAYTAAVGVSVQAVSDKLAGVEGGRPPPRSGTPPGGWGR